MRKRHVPSEERFSSTEEKKGDRGNKMSFVVEHELNEEEIGGHQGH